MFCKLTVAAVAASAMTGMAVPAAAQQPGTARVEPERVQQERQLERERAQADREREQAERQREREQLQRELERARSELEAAAREVARLSAEFTAPAVREAMQVARHAQQRALIGIGTEDDPSGVRVTAVSPNGPAEAAGLRPGDVIVAVDGAALPTGPEQSATATLLALLESVQPGDEVRMEVRGPDGATRTVTVQARSFGQFYRDNFNFDFDFDWPNEAGRNAFSFFGGGTQQAWRSMELVQLTPELGSYFGVERGVLVVRGPNRDGFGLRDGDVIIDIGGREPTSPEHAMRILGSFEPGETLRMTIMRRQRRETLELQIPQPER